MPVPMPVLAGFFLQFLISEKRELLLCLKSRGGKKTLPTAYAL